MSNNSQDIDRRSILKSVGGALGVAVGGSGVVSATRTDPGVFEAKKIFWREKVRKVYDAVGNPRIVDSEKIVSDSSDIEATVYRFKTPVGELRYVTVAQHRVAQFVFGTASTEDQSGLVARLADRYDKAFQVGSSVYTDEQGDVSYVREATDRERANLERSLSVDEDTSIAYTSELGGFAIRDQPAGGDSVTVVKADPEAVVSGSIGTADIVSHQSSRDSITAGGCDEDACWNCVGWGLGAVVTCGGVCVAVSWTIAGIVLCVGCLIAAGIGVGSQCLKCYNTCK